MTLANLTKARLVELLNEKDDTIARLNTENIAMRDKLSVLVATQQLVQQPNLANREPLTYSAAQALARQLQLQKGYGHYVVRLASGNGFEVIDAAQRNARIANAAYDAKRRARELTNL